MAPQSLHTTAGQLETKESTIHYVRENRRESHSSCDSLETHHNASIGWAAPMTMIVFYILAVVTAVGHFVYCYMLDKETVGSTIPQRWNSTISVAFANIFASALAASASTAFTQLLWWYLRRRSLSLSRVDSLFSLNASPLALIQVGILKVVPILWFFGLVIPLISIATIFPPGSLVVQQLRTDTNQTMEVPTLNVDNLGDGSAIEFFETSMFSQGSDGEYRGPNVRYSSIAKRTLLNGRFSERVSPCGANCTYNLRFAAPSFKCVQDSPNPDLEAKVFEMQSNISKVESASSYWNSTGSDFLAAAYTSDDQFVFDLTYRELISQTMTNLSCMTFDAIYDAHVEYVNFTQAVTLNVTDGLPLNATALGQSSLFYDVINSIPTENAIVYSEGVHKNFTMDELFALRHGTQLRAMRDTLVRALSGAISSYGTENYFTTNTIIQETELAHTDYSKTAFTDTGIYFNLNPYIVEDLMRNVSISIFNDATNLTETMVTVTIYQDGYVFRNKARLIAAYAGSLVVCLIFIALGFGALLQNGVAATSGGFMQILCTTTHLDGKLNQHARKACLGGAIGHPEDLSNLEVRFGVVTDNATDKKYAAFGTVEETEVLKKGL
ncbi:hypothetical protein NX059_010573 [Plenodomus lindquistii]|nr:hypothetical protein NX059_010573 [Plenodomus lindquistii]